MVDIGIRKPYEATAFVSICIGGTLGFFAVEYSFDWLAVTGAILTIGGLGMIGKKLIEQESQDPSRN